MWRWAGGRGESRRGTVKRAAGGREPTCSKKIIKAKRKYQIEK